MPYQSIHERRFHYPRYLVGLLFVLLAGIVACSSAVKMQKKPFSLRLCMEHVPHLVEGLVVLDGPRSKGSIIRDMLPVRCNGEVLFQRMQANDHSLTAGSAVFRVVVEYTGEVIAADVMESSIQSDRLVQRVRDIIMDTDFVGWAPNDTDAVFIYPVEVGTYP